MFCIFVKNITIIKKITLYVYYTMVLILSHSNLPIPVFFSSCRQNIYTLFQSFIITHHATPKNYCFCLSRFVIV